MMQRSMMMEHMMRHMERKGAEGEPLTGCPMMQEMTQRVDEGEDAAPDDHTAQ